MQWKSGKTCSQLDIQSLVCNNFYRMTTETILTFVPLLPAECWKSSSSHGVFRSRRNSESLIWRSGFSESLLPSKHWHPKPWPGIVLSTIAPNSTISWLDSTLHTPHTLQGCGETAGRWYGPSAWPESDFSVMLLKTLSNYTPNKLVYLTACRQGRRPRIPICWCSWSWNLKYTAFEVFILSWLSVCEL